MPNGTSPAKVVQRAFPGMREREAEDLARTGDVHTYPAKHILCQEGAVEQIFYILLRGKVQVTKLIDPTEVRLLSFLGPGDFFGEMALIHNAPRAATVATITPTTVLEINKADFAELLRLNASVSVAMVREVSRRLRENDEMAIEDLRVKAKELAEAYQQLAEQDYARQEFLTTIAHELRTPLTTSYGYLQAIQIGMLSGEELSSTLNTISKNIQQVISLVNDILFLQEMDLIILEFQPVDIGTLVATVVEQQKERAQRNDIILDLNIMPDLPTIAGDEKSLERVFNILLDNAIKFSPEGGDISVIVKQEEEMIWVIVLDHGVGIPPEAIPRIFRRFFRLDEVEGYIFSGAGLGLSIARQVVEQHGGEIEVRSELGKGSEFRIGLKIMKDN
ncbi:MAG: cyclic nucleotide-binding domain-containing protein, partial [Anaerolineales bacterium]|nr:cyclic nucleotide-binding domain-containing protein [Anaerolineales bacterium]